MHNWKMTGKIQRAGKSNRTGRKAVGAGRFCTRSGCFSSLAGQSKEAAEGRCIYNNLCVWRHDMPPPLSSPRERSSASRAAEQKQRSFPRPVRSHVHRCVKAVVRKAAW